MPSFDLRCIKIGKYNNSGGEISYSDVTTMGDAMNANIQLRFAEGRLYAEGSLAEYLREATGGTISVGVKYIPAAAQQLMYGAREKSRSITPPGSEEPVTVKGLAMGTKDAANYVGLAFFAPDMIDGVRKYTCVLVYRALFGPPAYNYVTKGENLQFQTPTTTGEFLPSHNSDLDMMEIAVADTEALARAWVDAVLPAATGPTGTTGPTGP